MGLGEWDHFLVAHAYRDFAPGAEPAGLAQLRGDIAAKGYRYVSDPDARAVEDANASGLLWDLPDRDGFAAPKPASFCAAAWGSCAAGTTRGSAATSAMLKNT